MSKKVNIFGRKVSVFVIALIAVMGLATAALIPYFGLITGHVTVTQGLLVDGLSMPQSGEITETWDGTEFTSLEEKTFISAHSLENQADVDANVQLDTVCSGLVSNCEDDITTSYRTAITDDSTDFGSRNNEVVVIEPEVGLTLNQLFSGDGFQYEYTVLSGGTNNGASPVVAVIDLEDGRHIALFPGWGGRTATYTLQYSETVAHDTGGNNYVDFALYPSDFSVWLYGSGPTYGDFEFVKADTSLITGNEIVTRVAIQHQAANTGQEDGVESMLVNGIDYEFIQPIEETSFIVPAGETVNFVINNHFSKMLVPDTYTITTTVEPA